MEILGQILDALIAGLRALVDLVAPLMAAIGSLLFGVEVSPEDARPAAILVVFLVVLYIVRQNLARLLSNAAQAPMIVTHYTQQTPAQVVAGDRRNKVLGFTLLMALLFFLYAVGSTILGLPPLL